MDMPTKKNQIEYWLLWHDFARPPCYPRRAVNTALYYYAKSNLHNSKICKDAYRWHHFGQVNVSKNKSSSSHKNKWENARKVVFFLHCGIQPPEILSWCDYQTKVS